MERIIALVTCREEQRLPNFYTIHKEKADYLMLQFPNKK